MIESEIRVRTINEKIELMQIALTLPCDVDIKNGNKIVDAKSELGVLEINTITNHPKIIIHSDVEEYLELFDEWLVR